MKTKYIYKCKHCGKIIVSEEYIESPSINIDEFDKFVDKCYSTDNNVYRIDNCGLHRCDNNILGQLELVGFKND